MSTLRTFNLQNPDSGTVNIEMDQGGNTLMTGIATVRGAAHFTSTSGSDAVGIGTDITAYKLDVRVTGAEAGLRVYNPDTSSNASGMIRLGNDDNQNSAFLKLNGANNSSTVGGAANLVLGTGTAREVHLATNGTSRLRITSGGNIAYGNQSTSTANNSSALVHISAGKEYWSGTAGDYRALKHRIYDNTVDDVYGIGISASLLEFQSQTNMAFFAGGAGSGTGRRHERMRIEGNTGNVSIGSASSGGWRLKVQVADSGSYQSGLNITNNVNADCQIELKSNETRFGPSTNTPLAIKNGGGERLRITSAGQMILGTASNLGSVPPKLTIVNDTNSSTFSACQLLRLNGPGAVGERGGIGFHYANSLNYGEKPSSFIGAETVAAGGAQQTDLLFATRPNTSDSEPTERLRITSYGALNLNSPSNSVAAGLLNVPNGSRAVSTSSGGYVTGNGGIVDMARYEMISMCITSFPAYNNAICAINGAPLYINDTRDTWSYYSSLPNYLLGTLTHDCINNSSFTVTLACTMTVFMGRTNTWNAVDTSGWNLIESNTGIAPFSSATRLYVKTLGAGTHTLDNDSALYFFSL